MSDLSKAKAQCKEPNCRSTNVRLHCGDKADINCTWVACQDCGCTSDPLTSDPQAYFFSKAKRSGSGG